MDSIFQYGLGSIKDFSPRVLRNLGSWIHHIETQYGFNISIWPTLKIQDSSTRVLENLDMNEKSEYEMKKSKRQYDMNEKSSKETKKH